jgi:hypothetical protein
VPTIALGCCENLLQNLFQLAFKLDYLERFLSSQVIPIIFPADYRVTVLIFVFTQMGRKTGRIQLKLNVQSPPLSIPFTLNNRIWKPCSEGHDPHVELLEHLAEENDYFVLVFWGLNKTAPHSQVSERGIDLVQPIA